MSKLSPRLIWAVRNNDVARIRLLREAGECLSSQDRGGNTLLHLAISARSVEAFDYLLTLDDAPLDVCNASNQTPLIAAFYHECKDFAIKLIERGCDIDILGGHQRTSLHYAILHKWPEVCEKLIERGDDINHQNSFGDTPLSVAIDNRLVDEIFLLLSFGADLEIRNYSGYSAIDKLAKHEHPAVQDFFLKELYGNFRSLDLKTLIYVMDRKLPTFPKLLENTTRVRINSCYDLHVFGYKIADFDPEYFKLFVEKFSWVIEKVLDEFFITIFFSNLHESHLQRFVENLYAIFGHPGLSHRLVKKIKMQNLHVILHVIHTVGVAEVHLETLTKLVCFLLSCGVDLYSEEVDEIYRLFGYCELFRIMLHMDIHFEIPLNRALISRMIYDVDMTFDKLFRKLHRYDICDVTVVNTLLDHCSLPALKNFCLSLSRERLTAKIRRLPAVPTLVELARNSARAFVVDKYKTRNSRQFYTVLERLPIAKIYKQIIAFERKLYPSTNNL